MFHRILVSNVMLAALLLWPFASSAQQAVSNEQQRVIDRARIVVEDFLDDPDLEHIDVYVKNAYAVFIVPDMLQAGFIIGAEYGLGVLLVRNLQTGDWSDPAFYDIYSGSLGLQLGGQASDAIFTIMNLDAINKLLTSKFKLGADASIAVGRVGASVGAGTTVRFGEDVYLFSRNKGLFGGLALDGSVVLPRQDWNDAYYGAGTTPKSILNQIKPVTPQTQGLRDALGQF
ncbi:MAG: lipid-binding SYLF domain-containing protein [Geminicoccaceae bacterium]|nr:lipid-binding SYLF domain-containing protein [Geminicoccaceae bacterium]MCB9944741.1 lipid-binding SYLF domain-containing protein [Geminicoccaceae bacterium]